MKRNFFILCVFLLFSKVVLGSDKIYFNFDYAVFKGENNQSILEIYYSVNQNALKYTKVASNFEAAVKIEISLIDVNTNTNVFSNIYKTPSIVSDTTAEILKQKLVGQINYELKDGNYKLVIKGSDFNDSITQDLFEQEIKVENNNLSTIKISDIELSTYIQKAKDDKSIFYKNTLEVIPNPSNLFGMNLKDLYYYFEIYGLSGANISEEYTINYIILNLNNEIITSFSKRVKRSGESKADFGKLRIDSLKRGSYILKIILNDSLRNINISNEKKFYVFNNLENITTSPNENDFLKSEYAAMSEKIINDEFEKIQYILPEKESDKFERLNLLDDKRKFLYTFWKSKDINPSTPIVEFKTEYFKRVNETNRLYKEAYKEGWKTDRGRIYIIYGKPDDIESYPFESSTKSYEIWKYNSVEGGGESVFIERQPGTGVYWLVHSTFRNELRNDSWEKELR